MLGEDSEDLNVKGMRMKKLVWLLMLAMVCLAAGCAATQGSPVTGNTSREYDAPKQNLDAYMITVKEQSDAIQTSLERDALTQADMNMKAQELYELWDGALRYLWGELELRLPEKEFLKLRDEQSLWSAEREKRMKEAGKEVEGGSLYSLSVNLEAAKITEERVCGLYERLKQNK